MTNFYTFGLIASPRLAAAMIALASVLILPAAAFGQSPTDRSPADRSPFDLNAEEEQSFLPTVGIGFSYDSNTYDTTIRGNNSWIAALTPALLFKTAPAPQRYALLYRGEYAHYFADSADDYNDHLLSGAARFQFSPRSRADFVASAENDHLDRGTGQTVGLDPTSPLFPTEPDEFDRIRLAGKFRYGADGNRGRLTFGAGSSQVDFTNNRARAQVLDHDTVFGSAGLSLLFHQRTAFVFDVVYTDIHYESDPLGLASRDGEDLRLLAGITWVATGKTVGSVRVGTQQRRFDDPSRAKSSSPSWAIDVRWSPREYSHFDVVSSRANEETEREGAFIDRSQYQVSWTHEWNRGWESVARWERRDAKFVDSQRDEDWSEFYVGIRLPWKRLFTWQLGYARRSRDSSLDRLAYDGNMFTIGVNVGS